MPHGEGAGRSGDGEFDRYAGAAHAADQRLQPVETRLRIQVQALQLVGFLAQFHGEQAHHAAQLPHRRPAARLDGEECLAGPLRGLVHDRAGSLRPG